jgi:dTDP-glucose 4,6-dehydratase/UDP-glucose 4-epimerase
MKYLVTGGTGFIGRSVVAKLLEQGHKVVVFDNDFRGDRKQLENYDKIQVILGDIRDPLSVDKAATKVDSIIHLAFINGTRHFYQNPDLVVDVGIRGMLNVADAAKKHGVKEIILMSSSETYQYPNLIPTPENVQLVIPDILNPRYSYGGAKIASELILINYCMPFIEKWKIIRPHNIYGPKMGDGHVIPNLINKIHNNNASITIQGNGKQTRAFCHIDDFKEAFKLVINPVVPNGIYNIGIDQEISILDLTKKLLFLMKKQLEIEFTEGNFGETTRRCPEISKLRSLGFDPKVTLETGLQACLEDFSTASINH